MCQTFDIDFVIPWVDGSDPNWIKLFNKYAPAEKQKDIDFSKERYRDYGLLKYWFRAVEKFAPYVRKVHFITNGQVPDWLNLAAPKLNFVKHSDYIPEDCLPVFSSHPIEMYMHKIKGLSEHFVYFNDDFFLTAATTKDFFFQNGIPCDYAISNIQNPNRTVMRSIVMNDLTEINRNFIKKEYIKKDPFKYFNLKYSKMNIRTLVCLLWNETTGFQNYHLPQPYLKSTLEEVWENCSDVLNATIHSRFRNENDVNQWLFRYWQLCKGNFYPINPTKDRKYFELNMNIEEICSAIRNKKYKEIVLNDSECVDFNERMHKIVESFDFILPEKSQFER
ncbi:MAG: Stealth CR1 domain-containing protein [Treponema sp.]|nr:Stealth CR1 domain-containing protein [Treponema sp.]